MMLEMKHVIAVVGLAVVYHRHKGVQGEARLRQKSWSGTEIPRQQEKHREGKMRIYDMEGVQSNVGKEERRGLIR